MKKIIVANWKMNPPSLKEAEKLFLGVVKSASGVKKTGVIICAPYLYLNGLKKLSSKIILGGQNVFKLERGAYTGEISAEMLYNTGARYVILGHSERRALGETNLDVNKKIKMALQAGLVPILCVGEEKRDENHEYFNFVKNQLNECLNGVLKDSLSKIIIAYEPVWAISSTLDRRDATALDCREMSIFIRKIISDKLNTLGKIPRIIYGGSVSDRDAEDFIKNGQVDGLLVGRASLDPKKFSLIVKTCEALNK
jgi:triosephosphate isomerase